MNHKIEIHDVRKSGRLKEFIKLPRLIYNDDPLWVPPLPLGEKQEYSSKKNTILARSDHAFLMAEANGKPVGRLIVYIDPRYNSFHKSRTGFFGSFESIDNTDVSLALFKEAESWLRERGMEEILGPINPVSESWGFVLEGNTPPVFLSPHTPVYYNRLSGEAGFHKAKDLLVYEADARKGYVLPDRFTRFAETILKRKPEITVRPIDKRKLKSEALHILRILNDSVAGNWGYVPVEEDEMAVVLKQLKPIMDAQAIWFVEDRGFPIGVALGFPDINVLLRSGRDLTVPGTLWKLLTQKKKIKDYRLWGLAVQPDYHGMGLDVLLYVSLYRALEPRGIRLEANYMLEDNPGILNALKKMELTPVKKYRVYRKDLI
ncbi:hypothetical protein [Spirochaeta isovalerica]|uniref:GNAT superfamily N-acetyltransferase n=1 Tax=Spirochaeta isovalerica TaxID=150 RepID=A0A841RGV5_9SPIO|nr:hypothetical protein [Spirochaeta isovalerica]MBB6481552.1 GNAT superfamily N-acetyltransferase [Spirochaeta isovalerica]